MCQRLNQIWLVSTMFFDYQDGDGGRLCHWYHGEVVKIIYEKSQVVRVKWDESCLGDLDVRLSTKCYS